MEEFALVDGLGREVHRQQLRQVMGGTIDMSALRPGLYVLMLRGGTCTARAVVMRV